ncbi:MAG: mechanosensitive ion channel family protein [Candidatus Krumholzibacteriota bacterium]|nr:mechanosensitive ion channel family protein [Candidatus Krumholzibacteriota bacterium]
MQQYLHLVYGWLLSSGLRILVIVVGSFIVIRLFSLLIRRSKRRIESMHAEDIERQKRAETLGRILETTMRIVVLTAVLLMILKEIGIDIGPLLAGAGVVGLAVGFGGQSLVKDVIGGFFILLENHMNVGDVVEIAGKSGLVESINLRVTTLRDLEGKVHVVPNGEITTLTNMTKEWSRALVEIGVAYKEDIDMVIGILGEVAAEMREDAEYGPMMLEPLEVLGLDSFGDSSVNIKVMMKTLPIKQWAVAREFRRRVKKTFDERGIEIPFPHVTLYMGEGENTGVLTVANRRSPDTEGGA